MSDDCIPMDVDVYTLDEIREQLQEQVRVAAAAAAFYFNQRMEQSKTVHVQESHEQQASCSFGTNHVQIVDQNK